MTKMTYAYLNLPSFDIVLKELDTRNIIGTARLQEGDLPMMNGIQSSYSTHTV